MTALAPASFSIAAEISPVKAPWSRAWQSWPPMAKAPGPAPTVWTARAIRVAGGQISTSQAGGFCASAAFSADSSPRLSPRPFIFQFPATNGRIATP